MTTEQLLRHYGTRAAIASKSQVSEVAVGLWFRQGWIPFDKQEFFEHDSAGALKADWLDLPKKKRPLHLQSAA